MKATITVINYNVATEQIENLSELPEICQSLIRSLKMESYGFQEVLGYHNRQLIFACGGYWNEEKDMFHITSMGDGTQLFVEGRM